MRSAADGEPGRPHRVMHLITGLTTGGAEGMLLRLLRSLQPDMWVSEVVCLSDRGTFGSRIEQLGIKVTALELGTLSGGASGLFRLHARLRKFRPALLQGWMYHGNLAALTARSLMPGRPLVLWNVRQSLDDIAREKPATARFIRVGARLSRHADRIIYNSAASASQHEAIGFDASRRVVLPNGFDLLKYHPSAEARTELRARCGLPMEALIVGHVARYHPMKDHAGFLRAAAYVAATQPGTRFLLAGRGVTPANTELRDRISELGLEASVRCLGELEDPGPMMAGLDVLALSSAWGEGFPNVLGEAMASGVPCVATDVGDARRVIGEVGDVVPPSDPIAMAAALSRLLSLSLMERQAIGAAARRRIEAEFSLPVVTHAYERLYRELVEGRAFSLPTPGAEK